MAASPEPSQAPPARRRPSLLLVLAALCLGAGAVVLAQRWSAETVEQVVARHRPAYAALAARLERLGVRLRSQAGGPSGLPASWKAGPGVPRPLLARATPGSGATALLPVERLEAPFGPLVGPGVAGDGVAASTLEAGLWLCRPVGARGEASEVGTSEGASGEPGEAEPAPLDLDATLVDGLGLRYLAVHAATVGAPGAPATLDVWLVDLGPPGHPTETVLLHRRERAGDVATLERQRLPTDFRTRALLLLDAATDGQVVPLD